MTKLNPYALQSGINAGTVADGADMVARDAAVLASAGASQIGAVPSSSILGGTVIIEEISGVEVTTTIGPGLVTVQYGAPINETWQTIISAGSVTTTRTA
jgi:hypothetical protein